MPNDENNAFYVIEAEGRKWMGSLTICGSMTPKWVSEVQEAIKFYDRVSAAKVLNLSRTYYPQIFVNLDVEIAEHSWISVSDDDRK